MARIPRTIDEFNSYINNTDDYLNAGSGPNWTRLGLASGEANQWQTYKNDWNGLYPKYKDKKEARTTAIKDKLRKVMNDFIKFAQPLLDRIAASPNATVDDFDEFNIKKGSPMEDDTLTRPRVQIKETPVVGFKQLGGGDVETNCRTNHDTKRASLPEGADSVQVARQIGGAAPANADVKTLEREVYPRALFIQKLGASASGQKLYSFYRFYNTRHPELAGPWTELKTITVL